MDQAQQITIMYGIKVDRDTGKGLHEHFVDYAHECPISGPRETEIVEEFNTRLLEIDVLYKEVLDACAEWIQAQP